MSLTTIYVTRHGFRSNWAVDHLSGKYTSMIKSPTGIPSDPALASHGVDQALELAELLKSLDPPIERFYSSPFYRCIQTINPSVECIAQLSPDPETGKIRLENGLGEFYGKARFDHPSPATVEMLKGFYPRVDDKYEPSIIPSTDGETIDELHDRNAYALHRVIEQCDKEGVKAIVICTHAASLIAIARALTGLMPAEFNAHDFNSATCSFSRFERRSAKENINPNVDVKSWEGVGAPIPCLEWRNGKGVGGGWNCIISGDCSHLEGGEERNWFFDTDEKFEHSFSQGGSAAGSDASTSDTTSTPNSLLPRSPSRL